MSATKTTDVYAERDRRAASLGWTYVSDSRCPRRLVRKHCCNDYEYGTCWCSSRHNDHSATWLDNEANGFRKFTLWEPYGADGDR